MDITSDSALPRSRHPFMCVSPPVEHHLLVDEDDAVAGGGDELSRYRTRLVAADTVCKGGSNRGFPWQRNQRTEGTASIHSSGMRKFRSSRQFWTSFTSSSPLHALWSA